MAGKPTHKVMVAQPNPQGGKAFYRQVGVAWRDSTRDGRDKLSIQLFMFPNTNFYAFEETEKPQTQPQPTPDEDTPF
jgi:hypothetical protein